MGAFTASDKALHVTGCMRLMIDVMYTMQEGEVHGDISFSLHERQASLGTHIHHLKGTLTYLIITLSPVSSILQAEVCQCSVKTLELVNSIL